MLLLIRCLTSIKIMMLAESTLKIMSTYVLNILELSFVCQMILRRTDGSVDFYRNWTDYQRGFGDVSHEHWIGKMYSRF